MASFAQTLRTFHSGGISTDGLLAEIEQILKSDRADEQWLLSVLEKEHTQVPLPKDVHDMVRQRIVDAADKKASQSDASGPLKKPSDVDPSIFIDKDVSRTQLATSFANPGPTEASEQPDAVPENAETTREPVAGQEPMPIKGVGDTLNGRFVLEERVGAGGMSTVYRALDRRKLEAHDRDPYVAVKVLNVEFRAHPDSLIALQREAKKCQRLAHPNIVRVYDFDRDGSTVYMTMEYLSGRSLAQTLRNPAFKGMPCDEAAPIISGMGEALAFAHNNGIIHADFKPANVIITDSGEIKVIDFGIARAFHKPGEGDIEATRFDPGSLGALTPTYASPEMLEHREPDPRDDVYALACITYELLTGRHPFGRRQATEARDGGLSLARKTLSRRQWRALRTALRFDRDRRTPSVQIFLNEIAPRCARRWQVPVLASASGLAAAGLAGFLLLRPPVEAPAPGLDVTDEATTVAARSVVANPPRPAAGEPAADDAQPVKDEPSRLASAQPEPARPVVPAAPVTASLATVAPVLSGLRCSVLQAKVKDSRVDVHGYLNSGALDSLTGKLLAVPGVTTVKSDVRPLTDGMCGVVDLFGTYWIQNREQGYGTSIRTRNASGELVGGEPLVVQLTTPPFESYVTIDYYSLDGQVVHMLPSPRVKANQAPASYTATLGDLDQWLIGAPFGTEMVAIVTTPEPLFKTLRKESESAQTYLNALKQRLDAMSGAQRKKVAADFVVIKTRRK
jgi:predicted Ser/Thr protein kinase